MGYSITEEQARKLDRNRAEGRLCHHSTGRGGCFTRATWRIIGESWSYRIGEGPSHTYTATFCKKHLPSADGVNFRVVASERIR